MISTILTVENTRQIKEKLDGIQKKLFSEEQTVDSLLNNFLSQNEKQEFVDFFETNKLDIKNIDSVRNGIDKINQQIDQMPLIIITTAYIPSLKAIEMFHNLLEEKISKAVVIDLKVNPQIIGGAIIEYNGKYGDFSLSASKDL